MYAKSKWFDNISGLLNWPIYLHFTLESSGPEKVTCRLAFRGKMPPAPTNLTICQTSFYGPTIMGIYIGFLCIYRIVVHDVVVI